MSEEWRDVWAKVGEKRHGYQVSNLGRVRSRVSTSGGLDSPGDWHYLTPQPDEDGRLVVRFHATPAEPNDKKPGEYKAGRPDQQFLDLLVLDTFHQCRSCPTDRPCTHYVGVRAYRIAYRDGDKVNCARDNLYRKPTKRMGRRGSGG